MTTSGDYPSGEIDRHVWVRYRTEAPGIGSALPGSSRRSRAPAFGEHRPRRAAADATSGHLRSASGGGHTAPPRGVLADAGRDGRRAQSSGCVRAPDRAVDAVITTVLTGRGVVDAGDASPRHQQSGADARAGTAESHAPGG